LKRVPWAEKPENHGAGRSAFGVPFLVTSLDWSATMLGILKLVFLLVFAFAAKISWVGLLLELGLEQATRF